MTFANLMSRLCLNVSQTWRGRRRRPGPRRAMRCRRFEPCEDRLLLTFHEWRIDQVFSSADGKVQFVELDLPNPTDDESRLSGHSISSNENTFTFPNNLPSIPTANQHFLIATADYAKQPGAVTPDYTVPDNFFSTQGDMLNYADVDSVAFTAAQLPTDGTNSMFRNVATGSLSTGANSETNLAGNTGSISVSVHVNLAPTIDLIPNPVTIPPNSAQQTINLTGISGGAGETENLTVSAASDNTALISNPSLVYTSPNSTGTLSYTPAAGATGVATITVTVHDDGGTANGGVDTTKISFRVSVSATLPPTANPDTFVLSGGATSTGSGATGVLANDASNDAQPQSLGAVLVSTATHGTLTPNADGSFSYMANGTFAGIDRFTYQATEGPLTGNTTTVTLLSYQASLVDKLYHQVLHRSAEDSGLDFWTAQLASGRPLDVVAKGIFNSEERLDPLVTGYYEKYLLRGTDAGGLAFWVGVWQKTGDPYAVRANILASNEFYLDAGGTPEGFVKLMYERDLGREPDQGGLGYWLGVLGPNPTSTQFDLVANGFLRSHEDHLDVVDFLFGEYFNGTTPQPDAASYVTLLDAGQTQTQVEQAIIDSPDYSNTPPAPAAGTVGRALYPH